MMHAPLLGRVLLRFDADKEELHEDLSAAVFSADGSLWVASDEHHSLERFSPVNPRVFGEHQHFVMADLLGEEIREEVDIEALDFQDGHLWFVGSHSAKRKKPKGKAMVKDLERLATVEHEPWRFLLARVPLPEAASGAARPAKLERAEGREDSGVNVLVEMLRRDPHLGPFLAPASPDDPDGALAIPSKDNGLDIEGLAVHGDRLFLGLRGPVLRGYAVILEMEVEEVGGGLLAPRRTKNGSAYRKHFVDLDGLGIRELCRHGEDLLILAGPTMPVDAPIRLFRLHKGLLLTGDTLHPQEKGVLEPLFDLKEASRDDNAEGVALFSWFEPNDSVLVVYDTPSPRRCYGPDGVLADVFRL
ncbi:DUF3616 domain-containing protein [Archangium violaceum]|uniref:DUF3616 domain-containing protein n=1 Tax=Archangium violaceum TaxID=83451 RepID=UPI002B290F84|nr:DUF3616 domain-containing protein [Archangium gephyra]